MWLESNIKKIKAAPDNVDEYVKQIQAIEYIDETF
jgi:hypothetical protein